MRLFSRIIGTGSALPNKIVSNFDLEQSVDTSNAWIVERTGILNRRIADPSMGETTQSLGANAALAALQMAEVKPESVDMVVVATCTPDKIFPSTACLIQEQLNIPPGAAFDVQAACSGFIYALSVADQFIRSGSKKRVLVIGTEVMSRILDWKDRKTCVLFGDGAGALLLEACKEPGIFSTHITSDGRHKDILYLNNKPGDFLRMQGNAVFKLAVNRLDQMAVQTVVENKLSISDIDWWVPHQANIRIIQATAEKLKIPMERVAITLQDHGNTSGASIPLALDAYIRSNKIVAGQTLLLEAIGGGLTFGTALVKY